jgi:hypothetical protein
MWQWEQAGKQEGRQAGGRHMESKQQHIKAQPCRGCAIEEPPAIVFL